MLCGAICYAANSVITRVKVRGDLMVASAATVAIAALDQRAGRAVLDAPWRLDPDWDTVAVILWIGVGPTAIATFIYFALIRSAGPTFMSMMNYFVPCVASRHRRRAPRRSSRAPTPTRVWRSSSPE